MDDLCQEAMDCDLREIGNSFPKVLLPHVCFSGFVFVCFQISFGDTTTLFKKFHSVMT